MRAEFSDEVVATALKNLGRYRVQRCLQRVHDANLPGLTGSHMLALGLRETRLTNIIGGGQLITNPDGTTKWIVATDPAKQDIGWLQLSRRWHIPALTRMEAMAPGTWGPPLPGRNAGEPGVVPGFTDALDYVLGIKAGHFKSAKTAGVPKKDRVKVVMAAHNAGMTGALNGWRDCGDPDQNTTHGDYAEWILFHAAKVDRWLDAHPNWKLSP